MHFYPEEGRGGAVWMGRVVAQGAGRSSRDSCRGFKGHPGCVPELLASHQSKRFEAREKGAARLRVPT